jgi:hypothetical protein
MPGNVTTGWPLFKAEAVYGDRFQNIGAVSLLSRLRTWTLCTTG